MINIIGLLTLAGALSVVIVLCVSFQSLNRWGFSSEIAFDKISLMRSVNNGGENILSLTRTNFNGLSVAENEVRIKDRNGKVYTAYYGSRLYIRIPDKLANALKNYIAAIWLVVAAIVLFIILSIRRILYSLKNGTPFIKKNYRDLETLAGMLGFAPIVYHLLIFISDRYLTALFDVHFNYYLGLSAFDISALCLGLSLAMISYVLKQGSSLQEQQELTI